MNKLRLTKLAAFLVALALPCGAYAVAPSGNTTAQQAQASVTTTIASASAQANTGILSTRISSFFAPSISAPAPVGSGVPGGGTGGSGGGGFGTGGSGGAGGGVSTPTSTGAGSGSGAEGIGVWALGGANWMDNSKSGGKYDGSLMNAMVGMDKQFGNLVIGIAVGYEKLDLTTKYNSGKMMYDGWSLTPFAAYAISKELIADASFSYTWLDYTMKDTQVGVKYSDTMNADRRTVSGGLTQYIALDQLMLGARLGTMYLNEHQGSYALNGTPYGQAGIYTWQGSFGLRGTYDMGDFKPFIGATYMQDILKSGHKSDDMWGTDFDLGFSYNVTDSFQMGLTGTYGVRENLSKVGGMLNVRYEF